MATYEITAPNGEVYEVTAPDNATEAEVLAYVQGNIKSTAKPASVSLGQSLRDIPRQLGLAGRYIAEPVANMYDLVASPIASGVEALTGIAPTPASEFVDRIFPQPQGANERVIGDISKGVVSAALPIKGIQAMRPTSQLGRGLQSSLVAQPALQGAIGGVASGAAGSVREAGGGTGEQLIAGLATGLATPSAVGAMRGVANRAGRMLPQAPVSQGNIEIQINNALKESGVTLNDLPQDVANTLRADVAQVLQSGAKLSKEALKRKADYTLTGATPRNAQLTLNESDVTREKNLAKLGANSSDPQAQRLARIENENNQVLLTRLDELGAGKAQDSFNAGNIIYGDINNFAQDFKGRINSLYGQAKQVDGRLAEFDAPAFVNSANKKLDAELKGRFLPSEIRSYLNDIATGNLPLNMQVSEQLKTILGNAARSTQDGNVRQAVNAVRDALENTPLRPNQPLGEEALQAFREARAANFQFKKLEEMTPALKAVNDGMDVDKFFDKFIIRSTARELQNTLTMLGEPTREQLKADVLGYLKARATNGQPNETARLSSDAMKKAMQQFGTKKLELLFSPQELAKIRAIERVAKYENFQPVGSAVNNSNTASAALGMIERLAGSSLIGKLPLGRAAVQEPLQNIVIGNQAKNVLNSQRALALPTLRERVTNPVLPYAGLLTQD